MREGDVKRMLTHLKRDFNAQTGPRHRRPAYVRFEDWLEGARGFAKARSHCTATAPHVPDTHLTDSSDARSPPQVLSGKRDVPSLEFLQPEDAGQLDKAAKVLRYHAPAIDFFLFQHVFPASTKYQKVRVSERHLSAAAW